MARCDAFCLGLDGACIGIDADGGHGARLLSGFAVCRENIIPTRPKRRVYAGRPWFGNRRCLAASARAHRVVISRPGVNPDLVAAPEGRPFNNLAAFQTTVTWL